MEPAIIVVGFKRDKSLRRLLESISNAVFQNPVTIILSLDGGFSKATLEVADEFKRNFRNGSVEIIARTENIGLRNHIIWCGDQTKKFGSVIVLEDDLVVDPQFYHYAKAAAEYFQSENNIGGISLYAQEYNEYIGLPFKPLHNGTSCYFMQVASSWGQLWIDNQWDKFKEWYLTANNDYLENIINLPQQVKSWPESSWKKYFSGYLAENNIYFVYPYQSYTTNVSDGGGTHIINGTSLLQTELRLKDRDYDKLFFCNINSKKSITYDPYMEPSSNFMFEKLGFNKNELALDIYGSKSCELLKLYKYAITSKSTKEPIRYFYLAFRPFENSILRTDCSSTAKVFLTETNKISSNSPKYQIEITEYLTGKNLQNSKTAKLLISSWTKKFIRKFIEKIFK